MRVLIGAVGWPGHLYPALAFAQELARRGHQVVVETFEGRRPLVENVGAEFWPAEEQIRFGAMPVDHESAPTMAMAAQALASKLDSNGIEVVVSDLFTLAPALAAEVAAVARVSLVPHPYPVVQRGQPWFGSGHGPSRSPLARGAWTLANWVNQRWRSPQARALEQTRRTLGLAPIEPALGTISDRLTLVATYPQLEYSREWPQFAHVIGPLAFEVALPRVEIPDCKAPLVVVAASTTQDPNDSLVSLALQALAGERLRVIAATNRDEPWRGAVPANATVVGWASYSQLIEEATLVISSGGHGTVARALGAGVPVLVCPFAGDTAENGARVAWAGAGSMLAKRRRRPAALRAAVRELIGDPSYAAAAAEIASWERSNDAAGRAAALLEETVGQDGSTEQCA